MKGELKWQVIVTTTTMLLLRIYMLQEVKKRKWKIRERVTKVIDYLFIGSITVLLNLKLYILQDARRKK